MKSVSASLSTVLLWQVNLFSISPTLASPRISPELAPRQVPVSDTSSANVGSAILGIEKATRTAVAARETTSSILSQSSIAADRDIFLHLPLNNSPLFLPSLSGCTSGYTGTVTFTSEFAHQTGFESIDKDQEFWNDTGAVWVVKVVTPGYAMHALKLWGGGSVANSADSSAISIGPASSTFAITVPAHGCEITRPGLTWTVGPTQTTSSIASTYTLSISGEYPCASNTILNPPGCTHDPAYALTQKNWQAQNVDQLLYEWWYKSKDNECNPLDHGSSTLNNLRPPDTSGNWPAQLAYWAANLEEFDCTMAGHSCNISPNPCDYAGIPPWAFLALSALMNLHSTMVAIKGALEDAIVKNSLLSYTILNDFIQNTVSPSENGILALTFIGAIVGVLGVFWTLLIPGAVVAEVAAEIAVEETIVVEEEVGAVAQIAAHIPPGLASPKAVPAQGAAIYGSIPGALITGSASAWSKIVANKANPLAQIQNYADLLAINWNQTQATLLNYNDDLFSNTSWSALLMLALFGGTYAQNNTQWTDTELIEAMNVDVTSRMINNIWGQGQTYVQFTDLGDAEGSTTKCEADLHGPQSSKYCADGGVYYLQSLSFSHAGAQVRPNTGGPYGYESLSSVDIEAKWICASSAKLYRQYGFNMDYTDVFAFTSAVSSMIADNLGNGQGLIGQLPGEWSLPVCDGGKNYYGRDYTTRNGNWSTGAEDDSAFTNVIVTHEWVPCACGYQGNETSLFQRAANFWNLSWQEQVAVQKSCQRIMTYNNNQGFLNLNGGPPPSQTVDYSGYHSALEISYQPTSAAPVPQNPPWLV